MSAFTRFFSLGLADADARWARLLRPRSYAAADRYLASSRVVRGIDRATQLMRDWSQASVAWQVYRRFRAGWAQESWSAKSDTLATLLLTAVIVHVGLTSLNGPRPGWFWLIVPGLVALLSVLIIAGTRTGSRQ